MVQYYLRHYFNPDFDYLNLKPSGDNGKSDVYSLGYVQNVIAGQVLAELVPLKDAGPKVDQRFILENDAFPMGGNTRVDPRFPSRATMCASWAWLKAALCAPAATS